MRVAVITPYYREPREWLERCISSVAAQAHPCDHILVADGHAQDWIDTTGVRHLRLDRGHADFGNTPRALGALAAVSEGYDAIAFLDADNWYSPDHVQRCVQVADATGADYVTTGRHMAREDMSVMDVSISDDASGKHVDTNCFFLLFGAFHTIPRWVLMPKPMATWGDRFYLQSLREEGLREARTQTRSVYYLCTWSSVYRAIGEAPPAFAKDGLSAEPLQRWRARLQPADLAAVQRLSGVRLS
jgi:glycosyltransferase involved in cell wall biosynthesis